MVLVIKNAGERSMAKMYRPVSLLFVVNKVFQKLLSNRRVGGMLTMFLVKKDLVIKIWCRGLHFKC